MKRAEDNQEEERKMNTFFRDAVIHDRRTSLRITRAFTLIFAALYVVMLFCVFKAARSVPNFILGLAVSAEIITLTTLSGKVSPISRSLPMIHYVIYRMTRMAAELHTSLLSGGIFLGYWFSTEILSVLLCLVVVTAAVRVESAEIHNYLRRARFLMLVLVVIDVFYCVACSESGYNDQHPFPEMISELFLFISILLLLETDLLLINAKRILRLNVMIVVVICVYGCLFRFLFTLDGSSVSWKALGFIVALLTLLSMICGITVKHLHCAFRAGVRRKQAVTHRMATYGERPEEALKNWLVEDGLCRDFNAELSTRWFVNVDSYDEVAAFQHRLEQLKSGLLQTKMIRDQKLMQQAQESLLDQVQDTLGYLNIVFHLETGFHSVSLDLLRKGAKQ